MNLQFERSVPEVWRTLQQETRKGWVQRGVLNPETVAEHTLEMLAIGEGLAHFDGYTDAERNDLRTMLEIHDWPESIHGDEITMTGVNRAKEAIQKVDKFAREKSAMEHICVPLGTLGEKILTLWLRFEEGDDRVAIAARGIDKYQAIERAFRYEREQGIVGLGAEFVNYSPTITHLYLLERFKEHCRL